jgi:hypothetical protein
VRLISGKPGMIRKNSRPPSIAYRRLRTGDCVQEIAYRRLRTIAGSQRSIVAGALGQRVSAKRSIK